MNLLTSFLSILLAICEALVITVLYLVALHWLTISWEIYKEQEESIRIVPPISPWRGRVEQVERFMAIYDRQVQRFLAEILVWIRDRLSELIVRMQAESALEPQFERVPVHVPNRRSRGEPKNLETPRSKPRRSYRKGSGSKQDSQPARTTRKTSVKRLATRPARPKPSSRFRVR